MFSILNHNQLENKLFLEMFRATITKYSYKSMGMLFFRNM